MHQQDDVSKSGCYQLKYQCWLSQVQVLVICPDTSFTVMANFLFVFAELGMNVSLIKFPNHQYQQDCYYFALPDMSFIMMV